MPPPPSQDGLWLALAAVHGAGAVQPVLGKDKWRATLLATPRRKDQTAYLL